LASFIRRCRYGYCNLFDSEDNSKNYFEESREFFLLAAGWDLFTTIVLGQTINFFLPKDTHLLEKFFANRTTFLLIFIVVTILKNVFDPPKLTSSEEPITFSFYLKLIRLVISMIVLGSTPFMIVLNFLDKRYDFKKMVD
jgi:hypothetical protein